MPYQLIPRHLILIIVAGLLIITNVFDEICVRYWDYTWLERKIGETVFIIIAGSIIIPIFYRHFFKKESRKNSE